MDAVANQLAYSGKLAAMTPRLTASTVLVSTARANASAAYHHRRRRSLRRSCRRQNRIRDRHGRRHGEVEATEAVEIQRVVEGEAVGSDSQRILTLLTPLPCLVDFAPYSSRRV